MYRLGVHVVFEECFICADDFGIFFETLPYALSESDKSFYAVSWEKGIAIDGVRLLTYTIYTASSLDQADNGPWDIVIDDDGGVLQVLAFTQHVSGNQDTYFFLGL